MFLSYGIPLSVVFKIQKTPRLVERRTLPLKGRVFKIPKKNK